MHANQHFDEEQKSFLKFVVQNNLEEVSSFLGNKQIDSQTLNEALVLAAGFTRLEMVEIIVKYEPDINAQGYRGNTALEAALDSRKTKVIEFLLKNGANDVDGKANAMLNTSNFDKDLILAVKTQKIDKIITALTNGANINAKNPYGHTSLQIAIERGYSEIEKILREHGATDRTDIPKVISPYKKEASDYRLQLDDELCALIFEARKLDMK